MADEEEVIEEETDSVTRESDAGISPIETEKPLPPPKYEVRPELGEKFQAQNIRDIITTTMQEQLMGRQYRSDQAAKWTKSIVSAVLQRTQDLDMKRYKVLVQSTIMEMKGAGIKCAQRCIWDPETDDYVGEVYRNDSLFCYTIVYGVYFY